MRPIALTLALCLTTAASADTTLAVLPLEKGAGSEAYDGLGRAMAGMVTSDLSRVQGLQLVERERLDALISELKLADEGYVDPATAGKLGEGLGAAWVVAGSYSVVGEQFLLSARIVDVSSGKVVNASDATGTVDDFVGVEKKLIVGLLEGLSLKPSSAEQAAIAKEAPTKSLDAMRSYGLGLERKADGEDEAARRAFEAALGSDPGFQLAKSELAALREVVEKRIADELAKQATELAKHQAALLARVPDERTRAANFKDNAETLGGMALRWRVLQATDLDCQRHAEMRHYLDRVKWKVSLPKDDGAAAVRAGVKLAIDTGLVKPPEEDNWAARLLEGDLQVSQVGLLHSTAHFLIKFPGSAPTVSTSSDFVHAIGACFSPAERENEVLAVKSAVLAAGQEGSRIYVNDEPVVGLDERLEWAALYFRAAAIGVDADGNRRVDALLALPADERLTGWRTLRARDVANAGQAWKVEQNVRLGLRRDQIEHYLPGIAAADPAVVRADVARCKPVVEAYKADAGRALATMQSRPGDGTYGGGMSVRLLADLGCLHGVKGRFSTLEDVQAWVRSAPDRLVADAPGDCAATVKSTAQVGAVQYPATLPEEQRAQVMWTILASELAVAMRGCLQEPEVR